MPRARIPNEHAMSHDASESTLRFPVEAVRSDDAADHRLGSPDDVLQSLENVSRRIDDLARELNCLGWFDDDDRPRAA